MSAPICLGALLTRGFQKPRLTGATAQNVLPPLLQPRGGTRRIAHWLGKLPPRETHKPLSSQLLKQVQWTHPSSEGGEVQPSRMIDLESHSTLGAAGAGLRGGRGPCLLQAGTEGWEFLQEGRRVPAALNNCPEQQLSVSQAKREGRV